MRRWPIANFVLIAAIAVVSVYGWVVGDGWGFGPMEDMVLRGWDPVGLVGHMFLHADILHLVGNLVFLWVFGNAVCAKLGNLSYVAAFLAFGLVAAVTHNVLDGAPAIGASGAINGVVGAFLILYPRNDVSCFYLFLLNVGSFELSAMWLILAWVAFDVWGAIDGGGQTAYWAHLGGLAAGAGLLWAGVARGWVKMERTEQSLLAVIAERRRVRSEEG
ncbi:MAG: rhomboid family intramembrane serine protease [Planctomycetota bacterium]